MWSEWTWWFRVALYFALPASFKRSRIGFNMFNRPLVQIERRGYISEEMLAINIVKSKLNQVDKGLPPACTRSWGWLKHGTGVIPLIVVQSDTQCGMRADRWCHCLLPQLWSHPSPPARWTRTPSSPTTRWACVTPRSTDSTMTTHWPSTPGTCTRSSSTSPGTSSSPTTGCDRSTTALLLVAASNYCLNTGNGQRWRYWR